MTRTQTTTDILETDYGKISACFSSPENQTPSECIVIAHGAKGSMNSPLVKYFHTELALRGYLTVRFNFPFAEGRMRLLRKPDKKRVLVESYRKVVENALRSRWRPRSLFLGGVSLGAAVASHIVAEGPESPGVKGLFFLSYPIHQPGRPEERGDKHLHKINKPMLFVSGSKDIHAEPKALRSTVASLGGKAQLHLIDDADAKFNKHKGRAIYIKTLEEISQTIIEWINSTSDTRP